MYTYIYVACVIHKLIPYVKIQKKHTNILIYHYLCALKRKSTMQKKSVNS